MFLLARDRKHKLLTHLTELFLAYLLKISKDSTDFECALIRTQFSFSAVAFTLPSSLSHVMMVSRKVAESCDKPQLYLSYKVQKINVLFPNYWKKGLEILLNQLACHSHHHQKGWDCTDSLEMELFRCHMVGGTQNKCRGSNPSVLLDSRPRPTVVYYSITLNEKLF